MAIPSLGFHQFKSNSLDVLQRRIEELQSRLDRTDIGTLLIPNIQRSDSGTYMCVGSNSVGSNSSPLKVSVLKADHVTWSKASGRLSSNHQVLGSQLRILSASPEDSGEYVCRVQGHSGNSNFQQASVSVSVTSSSSHNVEVSADGSVMTVSKARPLNHGAYRCVASNPFGITQTIVSLIVKESPVATVTPVGPLHIRVGDPINLECQGSGEPLPSVSWHRLDRNRKTLLSSPVPMEGNAVMQILAARPEDSGTYVCSARSNEGSSETRVEVLVEGGLVEGGGLQEPSPPRASVPEPLLVVVEGRTATLRCEAHGVPSPTISWSKLRSPLPWRHSVTGGSLVLPSVGRQDSGEYICSATNSLGASEVTVTLDVE
ncbi:hypothetical protein JOQ06_022870, partial [Pogonophryne albipinna]